MASIQVTGLTKSYGTNHVLRGIDLSVDEGEILGILGPNGAGKTTLVECIGGLRARDGGTVTVDGMDPAISPEQLREQVGMQLQQCRLPGKLTSREALNLFGSFYRDPIPSGELLTRFGLGEHADKRFEKLSGGQQQRLSVALALIGRPRIAILDELTTGLDPSAWRDIWGYLADLRASGIVRDGLTAILERDPDIEVVGQAGGGREALALIAGLQPDVVLMDLRMPDGDGVSAISSLRAQSPVTPRILVLTTYDTDHDIRRSLEAGADGYLLKDTPREDLLAAIRQLAAGRPVLTPKALSVMTGRGRDVSLTERELEVLREVAAGGTNREAAVRVAYDRGLL
ncbi:ATP-binding cassette domain-containing protein [Tessaracoccus massiliensis]|uniref:ATP-binding cassette domain-containing protein n=1 Tax=Tessaracoccus massiliensis TaxID=1522311 RepID=UPI0009E5F803|nr:ATP-binding cassette domain-containing protein [Tessaracoccus massiliensis]